MAVEIIAGRLYFYEMFQHTLITICMLLLLWPATVFPADTASQDSTSAPAPTSFDTLNSNPGTPGIADSTAPEDSSADSQAARVATIQIDSTRRNALRESLLKDESARSALYDISTSAPDSSNAFMTTGQKAFRTDNLGASEFIQSLPTMIPVRFGLSSSLNRLLYYGSPAPLAKEFTGDQLLYRTSHFISGTDDIFSTEISDVSIGSRGEIFYNPQPAPMSVPEQVLYWENGVFGENIVGVRFSRPVTRNITANAFSNYRHFTAKSFSHTNNDVYDFYRLFYSDTNDISNKGYNPLTNEHLVGLQLQWSDSMNHRFYSKLKYGDLRNEIVLDSPAVQEKLTWAQVNRYPLETSAGVHGIGAGPVRWEAGGRFLSMPVVRFTPTSQQGRKLRTSAIRYEIEGVIKPQLFLTDSASIALTLRTAKKDIKKFDLSEYESIESDPKLSYSQTVQAGSVQGKIEAHTGYALRRLNDSLAFTPIGEAAVALGVNGQQLRLSGGRSVIFTDIPYDSDIETIPLIDPFWTAGTEIVLSRKIARLLIGYRFLDGISDTSIQTVWPGGIAPCSQPRSVLTLAPALDRWHGIALESRFAVSDAKPYLKLHGAVSYAVHPTGTTEHIEIGLACDYWSERDTLRFAGISDWGKHIVHLNLHMAAHIKSFRLFYKIDNLLNRKYAYVPGYYTPGITFRWGFNWFIQQ